MSTHHMDEAEVLGDRIAIISNGSLLCQGSPLFLKSSLGEGYHLILTKSLNAAESQSGSGAPSALHYQPSDFATCKMTLLIQSFVPGAYLKSDSQQEWHYILPLRDLANGCFPRLFHALDALPTHLIRSYGVSDTSLEEIFLKVIKADADSTCEGNLINELPDFKAVISWKLKCFQRESWFQTLTHSWMVNMLQ